MPWKHRSWRGFPSIPRITKKRPKRPQKTRAKRRRRGGVRRNFCRAPGDNVPMDALRMVGGAKLNGVLRVSGSKNAGLPILAAALLAEGESELVGVPDLADTRTLGALLQSMGVSFEQVG